MSKDKSEEALNQAMRDALASVERIEKQSHDPTGSAEETPVEVEAPTAASAAPDALKSEVLKSENEAMRDQLLRMAADFDNFRKRSRREQDDIRKYGIDRLARDVLPIVDNLDRALSHSGDSADPVIVGVRMVAKQLHDALTTHGITPFPSENQVFDPERHEAVGQEESAAHKAGTVLREMQRGYMIHDRLLRPARVLVTVEPSKSSKLS